MFFPIRFKTHIQLSPSDLNGNFNEVIVTRIREKLEGVCSRFGYIKPGSLEVLHRSAGMFMKQHFNGHIRFDIYCKGEVCNPPQGMVVEARVKNKNALGLLAESTVLIKDNGSKAKGSGTSDKDRELSILDIIIPRKAAGIASEIDLDNVEIGDTVFVMVMGKRYQLNDTNISIIGRAVESMHPFKGEGVDGITPTADVQDNDASDAELEGHGEGDEDAEHKASDAEDEDYDSDAEHDNAGKLGDAVYDDLDDGNDLYEDDDLSEDGGGGGDDNDIYDNE